MEMPYEIVDVFAERPLEGNQLAVVFASESLSATQMQAIAREMNFSETTFVSSATGSEQVRIFTPASELPFAGHPVLGTASVLRARRSGSPPVDIDINLVGRSVRVSFDVRGVPWFASPPARQIGTCDREQIARHLQLTVDQLTFDAVTAWDIGPRFALVEVADLPALRAINVTRTTLDWLATQFGEHTHLFAFTSDAYGPDAHYAARMLFPVGGAIREDPATGSANACFAAYLKASGRDPGDVVIVEQGFDIDRPSRIFLRLGDPPQIGGRVQHIAQGVLRLA